jgi:McrBC 5-methylcytosine restriction system component
MKFSFVDSKPGQECQEYARKRIPRLLSAIDQLNEAAVGGVVELLALSARRRAAPVALTPLITYAVTGHTANYSWDVVAEARFNLSHYIGSYSTKVGDDAVTIEIRPRWGAAILGYLLQYTTGIYMPPDAASGMDVTGESAEWLLVLLWKSMFSQALRRFHIPKEYRTFRTNDRFFKGRLDVQRQIRENIVGLNPQEPVASQTIIDSFLGLIAGMGIATVVGRLIWPVLPQRLLRDDLLEILSQIKALLGGDAHREKIQTLLTILPVEALQVARQIRMSGCSEDERARLRTLVRALQALVTQTREPVYRRHLLPEITAPILRPQFEGLEIEFEQMLDVLAECFDGVIAAASFRASEVRWLP